MSDKSDLNVERDEQLARATLADGKPVRKGTFLIHPSGPSVSRVLRGTRDPGWPIRVKGYDGKGPTGVGSICPKWYREATAEQIAACRVGLHKIEEPMRSAVAAIRNVAELVTLGSVHKVTPHTPIEGVTLWHKTGFGNAKDDRDVYVDGEFAKAAIDQTGLIKASSVPWISHEPNIVWAFAEKNVAGLVKFRDRIRAERAAKVVHPATMDADEYFGKPLAVLAGDTAAKPDPSRVATAAFTPTPHEPVEGVTLWRSAENGHKKVVAIRFDGIPAGAYDQTMGVNVYTDGWTSTCGYFDVPNTVELRPGGAEKLARHRDDIRAERSAPAAAKGEGKAEPWYAKVTSENALRIRYRDGPWSLITEVPAGQANFIDCTGREAALCFGAGDDGYQIQLIDGTILKP